MAGPNTKRASLADIRRMKEKGDLFHDPHAPEGEDLGAEFWAKAKIEGPRKPRSVHLKLDPEVFDFFYSQARGKGHLTRMQDVLKAYMRAHTGR
ncbi:BrnA antitoxin family protein [Rhizobium binxianense]